MTRDLADEFYDEIHDPTRNEPPDPFPLLEEVTDPAELELPTVEEWLGAGAPLREMDR